MLAKINSAATIGLDGYIIDVTVDVISYGSPSLSIIGLPKKVVKETEDRVRTALHNSGVDFPPRKITINISPTEILKTDSKYDLPIAVGILLAAGEFDARVDDALFIGELSSNGSVMHTSGVLPIVLTAKKYGINSIYLPKSNAREAAAIKGVNIYPVESIKNLVAHLTNYVPILSQPPIEFINLEREVEFDFDMKDIYGQEQAKRALEVAAAGGHNLFIIGSKKSKKKNLAKTFPTILPSLTEKESLEITKIFSITNNIHPGKTLVTQRPFRSPHYPINRIQLIGGGANPMPGEISLAHEGVLYLDDLYKYSNNALENLSQSIEDGYIRISRTSNTITYPAKFTLLASANQYLNEYPLIDKIDLCVQVSETKVDKLTIKDYKLDSSTIIRNKVEKTREIQKQRYINDSITINAELTPKKIKKYCQIDKQARSFLTQATAKLGLTSKSYHKIIKTSQTIADLAGCDTILPNHIAESLQFRFENQE